MLRSACRNTSMQVTALSVRIKIVKALHLFSQPLPADWLVSSRSQQVTAIAMRREGLLCQGFWVYGSGTSLGGGKVVPARSSTGPTGAGTDTGGGGGGLGAGAGCGGGGWVMVVA